MIGALARDTARLFLRGRTIPLLVACGALAGLFVRATRVAGTLHVHGDPSDVGGTEIEMLASSVFVAALAFGVVAGLVAAAEDRGSGFLAQVAVRPVGRVRYVLGRLAGLALATGGGLALFAAAAIPCAGVGAGELPEPRARAVPESIEVDGRALDPDAVAQIAPAGVVRFRFGAGALPDVMFRLHPKVIPGAGFDGTIEITATWTFSNGKSVTQDLPLMRSFRELPLRQDGAPAGPFTLDATLKSTGCVVEIGATALGPRASFLVQSVIGFASIWCAATLLAGIGFVLGLGLSPGPASLAGGFLLLIGSGRAAVLDIIAGIGASAQAAAQSGHDPAAPSEMHIVTWRVVRVFLATLTHLVPDLARFDPSESLGVGDAIGGAQFAVAAGIAAVVVLSCLVLASLVVPLRER